MLGRGELAGYLELWHGLGDSSFDHAAAQKVLDEGLGEYISEHADRASEGRDASELLEALVRQRCAYRTGEMYSLVEPSKYFGIRQILTKERANLFLDRFVDLVNCMYLVVLYGSVARGDQTRASDVEFFIVLDRKQDISQRTDSDLEIINVSYDELYNGTIPGNILLLISSAIREGKVAFGHGIVEKLKRDRVPRDKIQAHLDECAISLKETVSLLDLQEELMRSGIPQDDLVIESCAFTAFSKYRNIFSVDCYWHNRIQYKVDMFRELESIFPDREVLDDLFHAYKARKVQRMYHVKSSISDIRRFIAAVLRYLTIVSEEVR